MTLFQRSFLAVVLLLTLLGMSWFSSPIVHAAEEDPATSPVAKPKTGTADVADIPPLPFLKAKMSPPLTYGYHVHHELPTTSEKWIDVDLSEQRVVAYEGAVPVKAFIVSTGLPGTPTVTGTFHMRARTPVQDMYGGDRAAGDYYYLPDVKWVQYFHEDYSFHGTYWHNNFGHPMSHGCINMTNEDAEWLFKWSMPDWNGEQGWLRPTEETSTLVIVHQ